MCQFSSSEPFQIFLSFDIFIYPKVGLHNSSGVSDPKSYNCGVPILNRIRRAPRIRLCARASVYSLTAFNSFQQ